MGAASSVAIGGQTLPPQEYSPRKNLVPKLEESILVPEETSTDVTMLSKATIYNAISSTFRSDFNLLEMEELSQAEKADLLDRIYAQIKLLTVKHTPNDPKLSEYLAQYSPRKIDPRKHEADRFLARPEMKETPRFNEAYDGERTAFIRQIGTQGQSGNSDNLLSKPCSGGGGMAFTKSGNIAFSDSANHRIVIFRASDGSFVRSFGKYGSELGSFHSPAGIAVSHEGLLVIADSGNHRVQTFTEDGQFVKCFGQEGGGEGEFRSPQGVSISKYNTVAIADTGNHRVQLLRFVDGRVQRIIGGYGQANDQLNRPMDVAFWSDGMLAVADHGNDRVQVFFMIDGSFERSIGLESFGVHVREGVGPTSVAVDKYENLAVTAPRGPAGESCVLVYDRMGTPVGQLMRGKLVGEKNLAVACDGSSVGPGTYAVADTDQHCVYIM